MQIQFKDFWPGEHLFRANLATLGPQVQAANAWLAEQRPAVVLLNVETLFHSGEATSAGYPVSNREHAHGVRVWYHE